MLLQNDTFFVFCICLFVCFCLFVCLFFFYKVVHERNSPKSNDITNPIGRRSSAEYSPFFNVDITIIDESYKLYIFIKNMTF